MQAYDVLRELFPSWEAIPTDAETCPVCEALIHISKEDKREIRRQAEEEKVGFDSLLAAAFLFKTRLYTGQTEAYA